MILEYIEKLRRQPIEVRRQAVTFWTIVIVAGIALLYIGIIGIRTWVTSSASDTNASDITAPY
jgi:hypothetical protein